MNFGIYSYLVTALIFTGIAIAIRLPEIRPVKRYKKLILLLVVLGVAYTAIGESTALSQQIWTYNPLRTLNIHILGAEFETYVVSVISTVAVASGTLIWARYEERGMPLLRSTWSSFKRALKRAKSKQ
jgi:hypothetical protein